MFCTKCGKELDDGSKFCYYCGQPLASVSPVFPKAPVPPPAPVRPQSPVPAPVPVFQAQQPNPQAMPPAPAQTPPQPPVPQAAQRVPNPYPSAPYPPMMQKPPMMQQPAQPNGYYAPYPMTAQQPAAFKPKKKKGCSIVALILTLVSFIFLLIMYTIPVIVPSWGYATASVRENCSTWIAFFWISGGLVLTAWALIIVSLVTKNCSAVTIVAIVFASIALLLCLLNCIAYPKIYKTSKPERNIERYYDDLEDYLS